MIQFLLDNGFWDQEKLKDWTAVAKFNSCLNRTRPSSSRSASCGR
jgi:hypothetical protein